MEVADVSGVSNDMTPMKTTRHKLLFPGTPPRWLARLTRGLALGSCAFSVLPLMAQDAAGNAENAGKTVATQLKIAPETRPHEISPYIFGQFIEHMGNCIYGGIWAEMIQDRKFFFDVPAKGPIWKKTNQEAVYLADSPWQILGDRQAVGVTTEQPLSGKQSLKVTANGSAAGVFQDQLAVLAGKAYDGRIVLRGEPAAAPVKVSLVWGNGPNDRQTVTIDTLQANFTTHPLKFTAAAASDNARLEIVTEGRGSVVIGAVSLMPSDNVRGFRRDTLELLRQLNSPIYRWPGGNFVSAYDWRDGLGDRDRRPTRGNPAWTGIEPNDMGMHEFVELCRLLKTEPLITVNTGFGDAYSAAAQIEYTNGAVDTPMGAQRAKNGSPDPFKVRFWCVGNEMWGHWQLGHMRLDHYVLKHNWVEGMMRKVDPDIVTIGSGDIGGGWSEGLLRGSGEHMTHIAEHFYTQSRPDLTDHVRLVPDAIKGKVDAHRALREKIPGLPKRDIRIAMTEWNYWYGPHVFGELGTRYFMKDALGIAAGLHEYFRNSDLIHSAFYAQTVNVIGAIKTTRTAAGFDATAYPLVLYRREFGNRPLDVQGWTRELDASAALTADGKFLTVGLVNGSTDTHEVTLDLGGRTPAGPAAAWRIANDNPQAHNQPGENPVVAIRDLPAVDAAGKLVVPPVSITLIKVPLK